MKAYVQFDVPVCISKAIVQVFDKNGNEVFNKTMQGCDDALEAFYHVPEELMEQIDSVVLNDKEMSFEAFEDLFNDFEIEDEMTFDKGVTFVDCDGNASYGAWGYNVVDSETGEVVGFQGDDPETSWGFQLDGEFLPKEIIKR
jgi:hypothetical protein